MKATSFFIALFLICINSFSNISMPHIFSDNMVIQRNKDIVLYGWSDTKDEKITAYLNSQKAKAKPEPDGSWKIVFKPMPAGGPYELIVEGKNRLTFKNVMLGDIWVCSGQSNMEWPVSRAKDADKEIIDANYPNIRLFHVPRTIQLSPADNFTSGKWEVCTPETVKDFSAVAYYFGRELTNELDVAIGLVNSSWGGTEIEAWTSSEALRTSPIVENEINKQLANPINLSQAYQDSLFNVWISSLVKSDAGLRGDGYFSATLVDTDWDSTYIPGFWEEHGLKELDGVIWYRKTFYITGEMAGQKALINLGPIDDSDITYLNGTEIGKTINDYSSNRKYNVPEDILLPGRNVLAVRIEDYRGNGGFAGQPADMNIEINNSKIPLYGMWKYKVGLNQLPPKPKNMVDKLSPNSIMSSLYNGMIHPIVNFPVKGVIWYQGESNANSFERAYQYRELFPLMIKDWRYQWEQPNMPFLYVLLANFLKPDWEPAEDPWPLARESQNFALEMPNTGMASAIDIGEVNDIHPKNKQDVGKRLALQAYKIAYGIDTIASGPMFESVRFDGNKAFVVFSNVGKGLIAKNKYGYVQGFALAGNNKDFYYAKAEIINENTIMIYSDKVNKVEAVRYGWANNPDQANVYNSAGLPATPFRTDKWVYPVK